MEANVVALRERRNKLITNAHKKSLIAVRIFFFGAR
jgi:hypothetical protein